MTRQLWLRHYRRLFALIMAGQGEDEQARLLVELTPEEWERLGARGKSEVMELAEWLYQERIA